MSSANRPFWLSLSDVWIFNSIHPSLASPAQHLDPSRLPSYLTHPYRHPLTVSGATLALVLTTSTATTATVVLCCTNARAPLVPEPTTRTIRRVSPFGLDDAHVRWNKVCAAQAGASVRLLCAGMPLCSRDRGMMRQNKLTYLQR